MSPADSLYQGQNLRLELRRRALKVWAVSLSIVSLWVALILTAPTARVAGFGKISAQLYGFFSYLCHQIPERTFHLAGEPLGVCTRCLGVYVGMVIGFAAYPLWRDVGDTEPPARFWLFASLIPAAIDWSLTIFGIWENTSVSRCITGLILGFACATFIFPAVVEIVRNLAGRRRFSAAR